MMGFMAGVFHFKDRQQRERSEQSVFLTSEATALNRKMKTKQRGLYHTLVHQYRNHPFTLWLVVQLLQAGAAINVDLSRAGATSQQSRPTSARNDSIYQLQVSASAEDRAPRKQLVTITTCQHTSAQSGTVGLSLCNSSTVALRKLQLNQIKMNQINLNLTVWLEGIYKDYRVPLPDCFRANQKLQHVIKGVIKLPLQH